MTLRVGARLNELRASSSPGVPTMNKNYLDESINPSTYVFVGGKRGSTHYNPREHVHNLQTPCRDDLGQLGF